MSQKMSRTIVFANGLANSDNENQNNITVVLRWLVSPNALERTEINFDFRHFIQ